MARKPPPEPPKRQSSQYAPFSRYGQTTVEIHPEKSLPLSLPAYPSSDSLSVSLDSTGLLPPPPAPSSPPRRYDEDKLRTGSDASFKVYTSGFLQRCEAYGNFLYGPKQQHFHYLKLLNKTIVISKKYYIKLGTYRHF